MINKILYQLHLKKPTAILNNDMISHDKISYILILDQFGSHFQKVI